jgi:NADH-quinone oxidoreductase subunit H
VPDPFLLTVVKAFVLINLLMGFFAVMTVVERKLIGRFQTRYGPNRIGPYGFLQFVTGGCTSSRRSCQCSRRSQPSP